MKNKVRQFYIYSTYSIKHVTIFLILLVLSKQSRGQTQKEKQEYVQSLKAALKEIDAKYISSKGKINIKWLDKDSSVDVNNIIGNIKGTAKTSMELETKLSAIAGITIYCGIVPFGFINRHDSTTQYILKNHPSERVMDSICNTEYIRRATMAAHETLDTLCSIKKGTNYIELDKNKIARFHADSVILARVFFHYNSHHYSNACGNELVYQLIFHKKNVGFVYYTFESANEDIVFNTNVADWRYKTLIDNIWDDLIRFK